LFAKTRTAPLRTNMACKKAGTIVIVEVLGRAQAA
jgi:hypothetical protein